MAVDPRILTLPGSANVRDLGGLVGADGREVRRGRLLRSDYPGFAADPAAVRSLGLRTVVDLRGRTEVEAECVAWEDHGVAYHRCPLSAGSADSWHARYPAYLTHRPVTVVAAVRHLMDAAAQPALFHCAAGKDRTGTVAALLLGVLGVSDEQVVADYVLTGSAVAQIIERLTGLEPYATMLADSSVDDQMPRAEHVQGLLAFVAEQGGAAQWLVDHGVPPAEIAAFRAEMLV